MTEVRHDADENRTIETEPVASPLVPSDTVGTGSYVAVSCTVLMIVATLLLIGGLLIARWLT